MITSSHTPSKVVKLYFVVAYFHDCTMLGKTTIRLLPDLKFEPPEDIDDLEPTGDTNDLESTEDIDDLEPTKDIDDLEPS